MANFEKQLRDLDSDYNTRRSQLVAEQNAADARAAELAKLAVTQEEERAAAEALREAQAAFDEEYRKKIEPILADLVSDVTNWTEQIETMYRDMSALIAMHRVFQDRALAIARNIGSHAGRHPGAFEDNNEQLDWINNRIRLLPQAVDLAPSSDVIPTDVARTLGVNVPQAHRLIRAYQQNVNSGLAQAKRRAVAGGKK